MTFTSNDEPLWRGYFYAFMFLAVGLTNNLLLARHDYLVFLIAMRFQSALIATVYKKSLRLSNRARKEFTVGKIVTLITVDCLKFMENIYINTLWSAPLQILLAFYFVWGILGIYPTLAGFAVMMVMFLLNFWLTLQNKRLQSKQMEFKDRRMKLTNEILSGIKVLKVGNFFIFLQKPILLGWLKLFQCRNYSTQKNRLFC